MRRLVEGTRIHLPDGRQMIVQRVETVDGVRVVWWRDLGLTSQGVSGMTGPVPTSETLESSLLALPCEGRVKAPRNLIPAFERAPQPVTAYSRGPAPIVSTESAA